MRVKYVILPISYIVGVSEIEIPADTFFSPSGNVVPVHPNTIEYAKKLLDELSASKPAAAATEKRVVPEVPRFLPNTMGRKMSTRELWGDSETDNVSETDWDQKKGYSTAGEESPVENIAQEDISSPENGSETESEGDDVESSGSNYESSSSFERRKQELKMKKMKALHNKKAAKSATSKQAAAGRKQKHNMSKERAYCKSPFFSAHLILAFWGSLAKIRSRDNLVRAKIWYTLKLGMR